MSGHKRTRGVMTERWGFQPFAWVEAGLPTWPWQRAPRGLVTRRQMREEGLAPGGAEPVAQIMCRRGRRRAYLYDRGELVAKRVATPAQLKAVAGALAARRWCPSCETDVGYCIPTSIGRCADCEFPPDRHHPEWVDPWTRAWPDPTTTDLTATDLGGADVDVAPAAAAAEQDLDQGWSTAAESADVERPRAA